MAPTNSGSRKLKLAGYCKGTRFASSKQLSTLPSSSIANGEVEETRPLTPPGIPPTLEHLKSTPMKSTLSSTGAFTSISVARAKRLQIYASETMNKFLGPVSASEFVDRYLPHAGDIPWTEKRGALDSLLSAGTAASETLMYQPLLEGMSGFCDGMELVNTSNHVDIINAGPEQDEVKPDITMYKVNSGRTRPTDMSLAQTHVEVKFRADFDPFTDVRGDDTPFVHTSQCARTTRGQITSYAISQFSQQYRTHLFTIFVQKGWVRLIRWDRSGAVVSQKFNISTEPGAQLLAEFLWRFSRASDADRGLDETVTSPGPEDAEEVACAREALGLLPSDPLLKFAVYTDSDNEKVQYCYGSKPRFRGRSALTGRCTRAILVWDPVRKEVVLLKDTWRVVGEDMVKEGDIYRELHAKEVPNIPQCYRAGDIPLSHHHTTTHEIHLPGDAPARLRQHQHYRLLLEYVGEDLLSFTNTRQLVSVMKDAIEGHAVAYEKAGILHRDISVGNILIGKNGRGYLIDWDLSKPVAKLGEAARQPERTGTWQFISARLLRVPLTGTPVIPELADDLESFFHVLCWMALRFTKHGINSFELGQQMLKVYDLALPSVDAPGGVSGGDIKRLYILEKFMTEDAGLPPTAFRTLLGNLEDAFMARYMKQGRPTREELDTWNAASEEKRAELRAKLNTAVVLHLENLDRLTSKRIIDIFTEAIGSDDWPEADIQRVENEIVVPILDDIDVPDSARKRRATENGADVESQSKKARI